MLLSPNRATRPAHLMSLDFIILKCVAMDVYHEVPYYAFIYSILLPASSSIQIDSSASRFQTLAADGVPPAQKIKFQIHIRIKRETTL
jgi:hypothetical protein